MSVEFVTSTGAHDNQKITKEGAFNKVAAVTDVTVTMEGTYITGGTNIPLPKTLEIEELMTTVTVSDGTIALYSA